MAPIAAKLRGSYIHGAKGGRRAKRGGKRK